MIPLVETAVVKALLAELMKPAARHAREVALGPAVEAELAQIRVKSLDTVVDRHCGAHMPRSHRDHVRAVLEYALEDVLDTGALTASTAYERSHVAAELVRTLRDPGSRVDIDALAELGVDVEMLLEDLLDEIPRTLRSAAERPGSALAVHFSLQQLARISEAIEAMRHSLSDLPSAAPDLRRLHVLARQGWVRTLRELYDYDLVQLGGYRSPACVFPAVSDEWSDLEAPLGKLHGDRLPAHDEYPEDLHRAGKSEFKQHLAMTVPGRLWNGPAYALHRIDLSEGTPRIECKLGRYFQSLATSELCDMELMRALEANPDEPVVRASLPHRDWIHQQASDPVLDGSRRVAAVSVAMVIVIPLPAGGFAVLLSPRSGQVATHRFFNHVAPSGIFAPLDHELTSLLDEYSVERTLMREYLEELYSIKEFEVGTKPIHEIEEEPEVLRLRDLIRGGGAELVYTGISVNLLTLRPEICAALVVRDPGWIRSEINAADACGRPWKLGWEWLPRESEHELPNGRGHRSWLRLDEQFEPLPTSVASMHPAALIPNAAAAISLALPVARELM